MELWGHNLPLSGFLQIAWPFCSLWHKEQVVRELGRSQENCRSSARQKRRVKSCKCLGFLLVLHTSVDCALVLVQVRNPCKGEKGIKVKGEKREENSHLVIHWSTTNIKCLLYVEYHYHFRARNTKRDTPDLGVVQEELPLGRGAQGEKCMHISTKRWWELRENESSVRCITESFFAFFKLRHATLRLRIM